MLRFAGNLSSSICPNRCLTYAWKVIMSVSTGTDSCPRPRPNPPPPNPPPPPRPPNPPPRLKRSGRAKLPHGTGDRVLLSVSIPSPASLRSPCLPPSSLASASLSSLSSASVSSCRGRPSGSNRGRGGPAESLSDSTARIIGARVAPSASRGRNIARRSMLIVIGSGPGVDSLPPGWRVKAPPDFPVQPPRGAPSHGPLLSAVLYPPHLWISLLSQAGELCRSLAKKVWMARQVPGLRAGSLWGACTWRGRPWRI